jgi:hypothetical protein
MLSPLVSFQATQLGWGAECDRGRHFALLAPEGGILELPPKSRVINLIPFARLSHHLRDAITHFLGGFPSFCNANQLVGALLAVVGLPAPPTRVSANA